MKKIITLLTAIILLFYIITPAVSVQGKSGVSSPDQAQESGATALSIDDENIYDGMDQAYRNGYTPQVGNGTAVIVLPLIPDGPIKGDKITVCPALGDPQSSPFQFKNYQKTVSLAQNKINGGNTTKASCLVRLELSLAPGRRNGIYPVVLDIQAQAMDGSPIRQSFTAYITVTDGKNPDAASSAPQPENQTSQPKLILSGYTISPSPVTAGEEFTVRATLKNTSKTKSVQNITVTAACEAPNFSLRNKSDTIYIDRIGEGKTAEIALTYQTDLDTPVKRYNITLAAAYDTADAAPLSSTGTILVEVSQPLHVELEPPQVDSQVNAGDTFPLSLQVMNLGRSKAYNVRIEMNAPGLIPSGTVFIGNMEPGTAMPGQMDVFAGTKDLAGSSGGDKYGLTNGTLRLTYEDSNGRKYTKESAFATTIHKPVGTQDPAEPAKEPEKAGQWWFSIAIAAAIAACLAGFLFYRNKKLGMQHETI